MFLLGSEVGNKAKHQHQVQFKAIGQEVSLLIRWELNPIVPLRPWAAWVPLTLGRVFSFSQHQFKVFISPESTGMQIPRVAFDGVSWHTVTSQAETLNKHCKTRTGFWKLQRLWNKEEEEPSDSHLEFEHWVVPFVRRTYEEKHVVVVWATSMTDLAH